MDVPKHIAIVMDGNGRWAKQHGKPRFAGHKAGVDAVKTTIRACSDKGVDVLTLFAFSSENWNRPKDEVSHLMGLLYNGLIHETKKLHTNKVRLRAIGDLSRLDAKLQQKIAEAESLTKDNTGLKLNVAINYGGRWDIVNAAKQMHHAITMGKLLVDEVDEKAFQRFIALGDLPAPDLFIRTSGEERISNFLLWQLAYSELYFTEKFWPDFGEADIDEAIRVFNQRRRRFGLTDDQLAISS